ncbi:acyl-CoA dehydrogenase family protein [Actinocorallia sp. A-T 12471]|uniref:acyl-CoA dehydrogenase family protein n=1 Tax=Actinocorallia sp. A-T 12471 TaxID=3089813 RepID=UPI0029D14A62|nr:acyl-CoA dehydrogenase family protein [Actinocorallia sp. A-T 12471]MDX6741039.1 acyl-CoA dehydrogenase family protein [Actinocorallia sp. A-T 12471]
MDARLSDEQAELRAAAARLADDLGPGSVLDLEDADRVARLEKAVATTEWRALRTDGASGVEVAIVAEEFGRGLVDVPFLGPALADDLLRQAGVERAGLWTVAVAASAIDARGAQRVVSLHGTRLLAGRVGALTPGADLTRRDAEVVGPLEQLADLPADALARWQALALVATTADLVGAARGAQALAVEYAKVREQYGKAIGAYQAVAHLLAESLALIEGSVSVLRHAAWAVDALDPAEAVNAARVAKVYCARAARTVAETAIQVHGGIGNTWECLAHVHLRRALASTHLFPVGLEEIDLGLL